MLSFGRIDPADATRDTWRLSDLQRHIDWSVNALTSLLVFMFILWAKLHVL
jgi:hypothetical protein